jgi:hypothetical protein
MNRRFIDLKKTLGKFIANFSTVEEDGKTFIFDGDEIREGLAVSTYDDKGDVIPVEDGEYTIKGVKVNIVNGLVSELPDKDSKPAEGTEEPTEGNNPTEEPKKDFFEFEAEGELRQRIADLEAEVSMLKEENEELKQKAAGAPVPQRTEMSRYEQGCNDDMKGTRFDRAAQIFGSK